MFEEKITYAHRQKKISQGNLGEAFGTRGEIIGKYERDEINPSSDSASKITDALGFTLDYLVKDTQSQNNDHDALNRLKLIEMLAKEERSHHLLETIDAFFAQHILQSLLK